MTLVFRNQLSQTATQIRTLLATPPEEWHAEAETRATLALLDLEDQIAVNAEYSESLLNEAARFEDGQRLFLSAFGKLPAASKDAEEKAYDDLLNDIRIDDLHAASRQMVGTISRRIRVYKRQAAELRAQIAQEQTRATIDFTLEEHANREGSVLRDILQNMQSQQMLQTQQMVQTMQDMLQALALPQPPGATTPVVPLTTTVPAVSTVTTAATGLSTTAAILGTSQTNANDPLLHASVLISSAPGGPFQVSTAPTSMPIYTTTNMGPQAKFTPQATHFNTPTGAGFGGQHQAYPQFFSSPFVPQAQQPLQDDRCRLPLPKIQIPYFYGEQSMWREFWQQFELVMSRHPELSNLERLTLLRGYLKGKAEKLIRGIPITEGNYQIVVSLLKDAYDDRLTIIRGLYNDLRKLEQATTTAKLEELYFQFSSICRQLELEGEVPSHNPVLWDIVLDKLSSHTLRQIIPMAPKQGWTVDSLKAALKTVMDQDKMFAEYRGDKAKNTKQEKGFDEREEEPDQHYTILSTMVDQKKHPERQRPCSFCQEKGHWTNECHKYPDYQTRVDRTRELHQCFKCLRKGHGSRECYAKTPSCFFCKGSHVSALCRKKFQHSSETQNQKPNQHVNSGTTSDESEDTSDEELSSKESTKPANQINTLIAAQANSDAEKIVSQTLTTCKTTQCLTTMFMAAEAKVFNPQRPNQSATALIILDSASHLTFISSELARKMTLPVDRKLKLCVSPFSDDSNRVVKLETTAVNFGLQFSNGREISIKGFTKKSVAGPSPLAVLKKDDIRRLWKKRAIPVQPQVPDILIGMDYFHQFEVERGAKLPSGFYLSSTALGTVISGRGRLPTNKFVSHSTQVLHTTSDPVSTDHSKKPEHSKYKAKSSRQDFNTRAQPSNLSRIKLRKQQAKPLHQSAGNQTLIVGHCNVLSQVEMDSVKAQKKAQQILKTGSGNKTTTVASPNSMAKNEGTGKRTLTSVQKKKPTPSYPKAKKDLHPATHVSNSMRPPDQKRRQVKPEAKVEQHQSIPKYCHMKPIPEKKRQSTVPQLNHNRGHKEWADEVFYTKKHKLRHQTKLDQYRVGNRNAYLRSRQQNLSRDYTNNPTKGPLGRCVQKQTPVNDTPCFYTGKSHHESNQMPTSSQATRNSDGLTRLRSTQFQTEFDPSVPAVPDSVNAEIKLSDAADGTFLRRECRERSREKNRQNSIIKHN